MENQMEQNMENEIEAGSIPWFLGVGVSQN